jgi:pimeloyl-ACP methyl ester carboxylesterase
MSTRRKTAPATPAALPAAEADTELRAPAPWLMLLEGRAPWEYAALLASLPWLRRLPPGDGHPVIVFPGLATDGSSVGPLRDHCRTLGYECFDWGRGLNRGPQGNVDAWMDELAEHVRTRIDECGERSASLVGWSLGGLYAREVAKLLPGKVRQVISIGTPFNATTDHTNVGWLFRLVSGQSSDIDPALAARLRQPPPVPTTSIYSRSDGVVAWQTCRHERSHKRVQDIEVGGSHIGMGWNTKVLDIVRDRLAQKPGQWRDYAEPARVSA